MSFTKRVGTLHKTNIYACPSAIAIDRGEVKMNEAAPNKRENIFCLLFGAILKYST